MALRKLSFIGILSLVMFACSNNQSTESTEDQTTQNETSTENATEKTYAIDKEQSMVEWKGTMLGVKEHTGILKFSEASLSIKGGKVTKGNFTIDWSTLKTTDSSYTEKFPASKLIAHLKSPDFFAVDSLGPASFKITGYEGGDLVGELTIRGITNTEKVTNVNIEETEEGIKATGDLTFDRQKYDVSYKNTMGDAVISDDIETSITLIGK